VSFRAAVVHVVCSDTKSAQVIQKYLESSVVQYIGKNYRSGRALGSLLSSGIIPDHNHVIHWTKQELEYIGNFSEK
jgi:hypothetical protein